MQEHEFEKSEKLEWTIDNESITETNIQQEDRTKSPYRRWTQFNNDFTQSMMQLAVKNPQANAILLFLVDQMDNYNAVMCSTAVLVDVLNVSRQTISKSIKYLNDNGFLIILKSGNSNVYVINDNLYWKSWGNNKKYCKFPSNIIISPADNEHNNKIITEYEKIKKIQIKGDNNA